MARKIPLTKKALEPKVQEILDRTITRFHLTDWKIYYEVSKKESDCCAEVRLVRGRDFKEASISIYPKSIREVQDSGYEEKLAEVLEHECVHILMWDCFMNVEDKIIDHPQFAKAEEVLAERIVRIINEH